MSNKLKNVKLSDFLFYIAWLTYVTSYVLLKETEIAYIFNTNTLYKIFEVIVMLILFLKIVLVDKYTFKKTFIYGVLFFLVILSYFRSSSTNILFVLIFILSANNVDMKKTIKYDSNVRLFILILVILSCFLGLLPNFSRIINGNYKQALGFVHPNTFAVFSVSIILEKICLLKELKFKNFAIVLLCISAITYFTNSRSCVYLTIVMCIALLLLKNNRKFFNSKIIKSIFVITPLIFCILSFFFVEQYNQKTKLALEVDQIITGRLYYASNFMNNYKITAFGQEVEIVSTRKAFLNNTKAQILDMTYINIALNKGIIILVIFVVTLSAIQFLSYKYKKINILLINSFFIVLAFSEGYSAVIVYNFILLFIPQLLNLKKETDYEQS